MSKDPRDVTPEASEKRMIEELQKIYDPEIPVDIYNLGLIYDVKCEKDPETRLNRCKVVMTLTSATCSMSEILVDLVRTIPSRVEDHSIEEVDVELVFDPPWDQSKMSDEAKLQLGLL
ncbi:iron-sulfur cluster assembly protein [Nitratifractor sp.]|uniref:metal-sulfur cluster assembly factor n=1 Tax=Nitratifractor sp. TaxID=2268144 RepID=UPI0025FEAF82|nr:iron-sulfur cluster assembly protein [Nitratifractor sp.]